MAFESSAFRNAIINLMATVDNPDIKVDPKHVVMFAKAAASAWQLYNAYIDVGFSPARAFELTKTALQDTMDEL